MIIPDPLKVLNSKNREVVEEELMKWNTYKAISEKMKELGEDIDEASIQAYHNEYVRHGKSLVKDIVNMKKDMVKYEPDPLSEVDKLTVFFSFQKTNEDLETIYSRIAELLKLAKMDPENDTYDKRAAEYFKRAEAIRDRVIKSQFEELRQSVVANIGKKIILSAISIFFPYISPDKRDEAKRQFVSAIESIVSGAKLPDPPNMNRGDSNASTQAKEEDR